MSPVTISNSRSRPSSTTIRAAGLPKKSTRTHTPCVVHLHTRACTRTHEYKFIYRHMQIHVYHARAHTHDHLSVGRSVGRSVRPSVRPPTHAQVCMRAHRVLSYATTPHMPVDHYFSTQSYSHHVYYHNTMPRNTLDNWGQNYLPSIRSARPMLWSTSDSSVVAASKLSC